MSCLQNGIWENEDNVLVLQTSDNTKGILFERDVSEGLVFKELIMFKDTSAILKHLNMNHMTYTEKLLSLSR